MLNYWLIAICAKMLLFLIFVIQSLQRLLNYSAGFPSVSDLKCALREPCADPARGRVECCHILFSHLL